MDDAGMALAVGFGMGLLALGVFGIGKLLIWAAEAIGAEQRRDFAKAQEEAHKAPPIEREPEPSVDWHSLNLDGVAAALREGRLER